ncbi:hypothetical protein BCV70DRAFT_107674 [Testicularia cyperi]|uniref:Uncharacterized protein n=1 Tax=Testicularia cyperi TaxID=1882483 RepID=A0A317XPQ5_9BASI|nr:hypothetical protein BCV70DRAFT_107674 [Testicularia cyperi]
MKPERHSTRTLQGWEVLPCTHFICCWVVSGSFISPAWQKRGRLPPADTSLRIALCNADTSASPFLRSVAANPFNAQCRVVSLIPSTECGRLVMETS